MTAVNPMAQASAAVHAGGKDKNAQLTSAARQFESVLLQQLLQVLWKSSPELSHGQGAMYQSMFQSAFADHLAESGGIGLAHMIASGLGVKDDKSQLQTRHVDHAAQPRAFKLEASALDSGGAPSGVMADVTTAASQMLQTGGQQWAKDGTLSTEDLGTVNVSQGAGERARASVLHAQGYQGYYKCNLFAFELARRAGLEVPLTERGTGLSFPSSNRVTEDASDGGLNTGWAKVVTGASPAAMQDALHAGGAAFMLVGSGHGERHGHMAVIEKPRAIEYDSDGQVRSIQFDGWEAQPDGAKHLTHRTWNRYGHQGAAGDRNGLDRIEIIQLRRMNPGSISNPTTHAGPDAQPDLGLSKTPERPTQGTEERS